VTEALTASRVADINRPLDIALQQMDVLTAENTELKRQISRYEKLVYELTIELIRNA